MRPGVWMPLAGAAMLQIDGWDQRTSAWARAHTPVFGSQASAERWSDRLRAFPAIVEAGSVLATPGGEDPAEWITSKVELAAIDFGAVGATLLTVKGLKGETRRERPNGIDRESLPSGHAASAAANANLAELNLRNVAWSPAATRTVDFALDAAVFGTGWARVESGWHYPSDTLVAIALANFITSFAHLSFFGGETPQRISFVPDRGGAQLRVSLVF
jgi:hypothetical protein